MPLQTVTDARLAAVAALQPAADGDPNVQMTADAVSPPTLIVYWSEPWLEPATSTGLRRMCSFSARLSVLAVAGRIEPGEGVAELEQLVGYVAARLDAPDRTMISVGTPLRWRAWLDQTEYLAAEIRYRTPVYLEG